MPPVPVYLCLNGLIFEGFDTQVHFIPVGVPSAEKPHVSNGVSGVLMQVEEWSGIEMV
jgi:hypothetical protein